MVCYSIQSLFRSWPYCDEALSRMVLSLNVICRILLRLRKTSGLFSSTCWLLVHFVLERRERLVVGSLFTTRDARSTVLFRVLWSRVVILPVEMELEVNRFMERSSVTRTSTTSIPDPACSRWLMLEETRMAPSFSSLPYVYIAIASYISSWIVDLVGPYSSSEWKACCVWRSCWGNECCSHDWENSLQQPG